MADRGAQVDAGHVPGRLDLIAAVAVGLRDRRGRGRCR